MEAGNTPQCQAWRERIYSRHRSLSYSLKRQHKAIAKKKKSYVAANVWLRETEQALKLGRTGLFCDSYDEQIKDYAEAKAKKTEKQIFEAAAVMGNSLTLAQLVEFLEPICEAAAVEFPVKPGPDPAGDKAKAAIRRLVDAKWWRRQLRKVAARQYDQVARSSFQVSYSREIYCSDFTLKRRREQKGRNRRLLESLEAENSQGQVFTLAELADLSVSNPINRRHELMARISGFEDYAKKRPFAVDPFNGELEYMGLFVTLTTPSKYHPCLLRKNSKDKKYAVPNRKYQGFTPKEANDYLCDVWAKTRAEWARCDINPFGFRMVEPHHDGTPHWHAILFIPAHKMKEAKRVLTHYALLEDGDEPGALENRVKLVDIDPNLGTGAGYCAKYVSKNIDGFGLDADLYGRDAIRSAMRIEAWATTWGIRQFQQIGGASVTVWREARRVKEEKVSVFMDEHTWAIIDAADAGDWELYTDLMGGAICPRAERPLRPMMIEKLEPNQYGEFVEFLAGLLPALGSGIPTRLESWTIRPVSNASTKICAAPAAANAPPERVAA
jgi:hypothetical protein